MPEESYKSRNRGFVTSSKLKAFGFCQYLYYLAYEKESVPELDSDAILFGSAVDKWFELGEKKWKEDWAVVSVRISEEKLAEKIEAKKAQLEKAKTPVTKEKYASDLKELQKLVGKRQITQTMWEKVQGCDTEAQRSPLWSFDPKLSKKIIELPYKSLMLRGEMDQLKLAKNLIEDVKTTGAIANLERNFMEGYKIQLSFYQLLVQLKHDVLCDGRLEVLTNEKIVKSIFYFASKQGLLDYRVNIIRLLDELVKCKERGIYAAQPPEMRQEKCLNCQAYGQCNHAVQKKDLIIC